MLSKLKKLFPLKTKVASSNNIKSGYSQGRKDFGSPEQWRKG